jgi:hypothetical protein
MNYKECNTGTAWTFCHLNLGRRAGELPFKGVINKLAKFVYIILGPGSLRLPDQQLLLLVTNIILTVGESSCGS